MAGVFNIQFGMNETPLTQALESGNFNSAESMIRNCTTSSYLDEGFYTRTPLFISLKPDPHQPRSAINFHITKLLVQHGADPNLRIPNTDGAEFIDPGQTPLELVTETFRQLCSCRTENPTSILRFPNGNPMIGIHKKPICDLDNLQEQVYEMCVTLLGFGAEINVIGNGLSTPVDDVLQCCGALPKLLELFLENGADVNASLLHKNTPLMNLMNFCSNRSLLYSLGVSCARDHEKNTLRHLETVLEFGTVELNKVNRAGQTALILACGAGGFSHAKLLLEAGASPDAKGDINLDALEENQTVQMTPLFSMLTSHYVKEWIDDFPWSSLSLHHLGEVIDTGKFCSEIIWEEFSHQVQKRFFAFEHLLHYGPKLINRMFGQTTSDLVQKSVRIVFQCLMREHGLSRAWKDCQENALKIQHYWRGDNFVNSNLGFANMTRIVADLGLPADMRERFEIELLRVMFCAFFKFSSIVVLDEDFVEDSDSEIEVEGDSDLEYW